MKMLFTRVTTQNLQQRQKKHQEKKNWKEKLSWLTFLSSSFLFSLMLSKETSENYLLIKLKVTALESFSKQEYYVICKHILRKCYNC